MQKKEIKIWVIGDPIFDCWYSFWTPLWGINRTIIPGGALRVSEYLKRIFFKKEEPKLTIDYLAEWLYENIHIHTLWAFTDLSYKSSLINKIPCKIYDKKDPQKLPSDSLYHPKDCSNIAINTLLASNKDENILVISDYGKGLTEQALNFIINTKFSITIIDARYGTKLPLDIIRQNSELLIYRHTNPTDKLMDFKYDYAIHTSGHEETIIHNRVHNVEREFIKVPIHNKKELVCSVGAGDMATASIISYLVMRKHTYINNSFGVIDLSDIVEAVLFAHKNCQDAINSNYGFNNMNNRKQCAPGIYRMYRI